MVFVRLVLFIGLTSVYLTSALAQQRDQKTRKSSKPPAAVNRETEELRLSAISLLHSLAQSANEVDNIAERVRVLAEIGDAFWSVDAEHARAVLIRSFKEIDKLSAGTDKDPEQLAAEKRELRRLVLSRIAKREPALANQLIRDLPNELPTADEKFMRQQGIATANAEALLGVAESMLASDPKRAAAIAAYSLKDGLSQQLRLFLIRLRAKDAVAADGLFRAAIKEAAAQHPARLFDVLVLWEYAYQPHDFYFNGISWTREKNEPVFTTAQDLKRLALAFAVTAVIENLQQLPAGGDSTKEDYLVYAQLGALHSVIQQLLPAMQVDWPRGTADLQQALVRVEQEFRTRGQPAPTRPPLDDVAPESNAVDSLIEKAAEAPQGDARDSLYLGAAFSLFKLGQFEKGKEIAARIDNLERRAMILEPLNYCLAGELVEKNSLQEALTIANQLKTPDLRVMALARVGRAFIEAGDTQSGGQTLNTAQSIVSKTDPTMELSGATLRIAAAFAKSDPIRTEEAITLSIQVMNKAKQEETSWILLSPARSEDGFIISWKNARGGGLTFLRFALPASGGLTELLSKLEFNQAVSLAKSINNKALSLAVQAAICRNAIEGKQ